MESSTSGRTITFRIHLVDLKISSCMMGQLSGELKQSNRAAAFTSMSSMKIMSQMGLRDLRSPLASKGVSVNKISNN